MPAMESLRLPPGFRFHPTDDELVMHYLIPKCASLRIDAPIIAEVDLYKYDPWDLPDLALYGEKEWYYFSPRDRKYPNGCRPNRAAGSGYWKATGADKPIGKPKAVGIKKSLVFYAGKAPKGEKTNWIMHEYRLADVDRSARKKNNSLRLDDWVLCRIYNKKGTLEKQIYTTQPPQQQLSEPEERKPDILLDVDTSESVPKLHTDSSCSERVVSPGFEVQSDQKLGEWERAAFDFSFNYMDPNTNAAANVFASQAALPPLPLQNNFQASSQLQDMFMYLQKPF